MLFLKAMSWWYDNIDTTHEHYGLGLASWLCLTVYSWNVSAPEGQPEHKLSVITNLGDQIILVISACWIVWVALQGSKSEISEFRVKSKLDPSLFLSSVQTGPARKLHARLPSPDWSCQTEAGTSNHTGPQLIGDAEPKERRNLPLEQPYVPPVSVCNTAAAASCDCLATKRLHGTFFCALLQWCFAICGRRGSRWEQCAGPQGTK